MAGLYIREMLARGLIQRVLVVPPAGLVGNWGSEMHVLFSLPFRAIDGGDARSANPFLGPESDLLIVSVDTLAVDRTFSCLQAPEVAPYDLVIFDEAHKLSAHREPEAHAGASAMRKTNRYRLAEVLAGIPAESERWRLDWSCRHLLLLTATPHMGVDYPYYCLWRLLEPEALSTVDAFHAYPPEARRRHFIRRTKEEMVDFQGQLIYPKRVSDTLSYGLTTGETSEQRLYDEMTHYMRTCYNQARMLNRSAARLAMSVFQRRLASSTYALLRSLENRLLKLEGWIEAILSGEITEEDLLRRQQQLDGQARDVLDETTADEEEGDTQEENEAAEDQALAGTVAVNLAQLLAERQEVLRLRDLARRVYEDPAHEDSKFARLLEVMRDPRYRDEKMIVFTEHRDTLSFLVRRLEQIGYGGEIAQIHGGMPYKQREAQVEFFRQPVAERGARYLVATDAAGEGINLQFCWLMVNYDLPWNPARLEQRMGRIHRYGQKHDPVVVLNLVAGETREGRVIRTLLDKLKTIADEMGRDKVYDVVGRLLQGTSIKDYMERLLTEEKVDAAARDLDARLTQESVEAVRAQERALYGQGDDPRHDLDRQQDERQVERYRRLLPGHVRSFLERAVPMLGLRIDGDLDGYFSLRPVESRALDPLWPALETYPEALRDRLTLTPERSDRERKGIFFRPGEPIYNRLAALFSERYAPLARQGSTFIDPLADEPYLFYLARVDVVRIPDPQGLEREQPVETRLVGLRQAESGEMEQVPVEHLLLLRGGPGVYGPYMSLVARFADLRASAREHLLEHVAAPLAEERRRALLEELPERLDYVRRGYDLREAELADARQRARRRARLQAGQGSPRAKGELSRVKEAQRALSARRAAALAALESEPARIVPGEVTFVTQALVMPSDDPEDERIYHRETERVAMREAIAHEQSLGATVRDVSTPPLALEAGLEAHPGFDLLSTRADGEIRQIEVKGRADTSGPVELSYNEWLKAAHGEDDYWLYAVYGCATPTPFLWRVRNPFKQQLGGAKESWTIDKREIVEAAEAH